MIILLSLITMKIRRNNSERITLSMDSDILKEASDRSGGEFTLEEMSDVWMAAEAYIYHMQRYSNATDIRVPRIGRIKANVKQMESRLNHLMKMKSKNNKLTNLQENEVAMLKDKIEYLKKNHPEKGTPYTKNIQESHRKFNRGFTYEEIEDLQYKNFK